MQTKINDRTAWRVTDDDFTTGVNIGFDEYLNITMSGFTFVTNIEVCCQKPDNVAEIRT